MPSPDPASDTVFVGAMVAAAALVAFALPYISGAAQVFGWYKKLTTKVQEQIQKRGLENKIPILYRRFTVALGVLMVLFMAYLVYRQNTQLAAQRDELTRQRDNAEHLISKTLIPFQKALQLWVAPRRLEMAKRPAFAEELAKHPPYSCDIKAERGDLEATRFAADIRRAIVAGGWVTPEVIEVEKLRPGTHIFFNQTDENAKKVANPLKLTPKRILEEGFRKAAIRVGTGGGRATGSVDELIIEIGPRPYEEMQEWPDEIPARRE